jgi:hypothetical protein
MTQYSMQAVLKDWIPNNQKNNKKKGTDDGDNLLLCDLGGGLGTTVEIILQQHPHFTVLIMDQPNVIRRANE